jgi:hypothetical protein
MDILEFSVQAQLPVIEGNFKTIEKKLNIELQKYDILVTEDNVDEAKKLATELNKVAGEIDKKRKDKVKEISVPIKDFEASAKELVSMCQDGRTKLLERVKVFEDKKRERCRELLLAKLEALYSQYNIDNEFKTANIDDLVIISNLTQTSQLEKSNLTKKAIDAIDYKVMLCEKNQKKIYNRIAELPEKSKNLEVILTRADVENFLKLDDETYSSQLDNLIKRELRRQEQIKAKARAEAEAKARAEALKEVQVQTSQLQTVKPAEKVVDKAKPSNTKSKYKIEIICEIETDALPQLIQSQLMAKLQTAGIKDSLKDLKIIKV